VPYKVWEKARKMAVMVAMHGIYSGSLLVNINIPPMDD
jgi:hypothetical protein